MIIEQYYPDPEGIGEKMKKNCAVCGVEYQPTNGWEKRQKYCGSKHCLAKAKRLFDNAAVVESKTCIVCNVNFSPYRNSQTTCSKKCRRIRGREICSTPEFKARKNAARRKIPIEKECLNCGKSFVKNINKYCSEECFAESRRMKKRVKPQPKECMVCGTTFTHGRKDKQICSVECKKVHRKEYMKKFDKNKIEKCAFCGKSFRKLGTSITCSKECSESLAKAREKRWREENFGILSAKKCKYQKKNRAALTKRKREWREARRPPKVDIQCKECKGYFTPTTRHKNYAFCSHNCKVNWWAKDPKTNISNRVRGSMHQCLKKRGMTKGGKTFEMLGYTPTDLMNHLESQFTDGMSWDNRNKWHIDHIRPVASFDYDSTDHPDFKKCWGLNNLQPLWAADNMRKKDKWDGVVNV